MVASWPTCRRGRVNRADQGRRPQSMPESIGEAEDAGSATVCSVNQGWVGRGAAIYLVEGHQDDRRSQHVQGGQGQEDLPAEGHELVVAETGEGGPDPDEEQDQEGHL